MMECIWVKKSLSFQQERIYQKIKAYLGRTCKFCIELVLHDAGHDGCQHGAARKNLIVIWLFVDTKRQGI